ncbi:MAG: hypothetical protein ACREIJ_03840 [Nitrospiraceae bacterium]
MASKPKRLAVGPKTHSDAASSQPPAPPNPLDPKAKLTALVKLVTGTAKAKGWISSLVANDKKNHRYATVSVFRRAPGTSYEITGTFEIMNDDRIRIKYHPTSFYSHGLADLQEAIGNEIHKLPWIKREAREDQSPISEIAILERLLRRFHRTIRQLKHRHDDRPPLLIEDEYDVQDLLQAMLRGLFDDVRPEEYTPSYGGAASRMDFLLKSEQIVLETKMASPTLRDKQIGEQLIIDIKRYQSHPDCHHLLCFIYDPAGYLKNPSGLENDLSRGHDKLKVKVIVVSP